MKNVLIILYKIVIRTLKKENAQTFFQLLESKVSVSFPLAYHILIKIFFFLSLFIFLRNLVTLRSFVIFLHIFEPLPVLLCLPLLIQGSFPKRHLPNNQVYGTPHSSLVFFTLSLLILFHSTYHHFKMYCLFVNFLFFLPTRMCYKGTIFSVFFHMFSLTSQRGSGAEENTQ